MNRIHTRRIALSCFLLLGVGLARAEPWNTDTFVLWALPQDAKEQTAVVSNSDWLCFYDSYFGTPGTRAIINEAAAAGVRTLWWRVSGGGVALYPSRVPEASVRNCFLNAADFGRYDSLQDAVEYAHKLGLKLFAWYTPLEESHGWYGNSQSRFSLMHPELYERSFTGVVVRTPSFYFPAYRTYKLDWVKDIVSRYDIDGLAIDFERRGAPIRHENMGYLPKAIREFQTQTGRTDVPDPYDEEWMRFRAAWVGAWLRDVHDVLKAKNPDLILELMAYPSISLSSHWDIVTWAKEKFIDRLAMLNGGPEGWASPGLFPREQYEIYSRLPISLAVVNYARTLDRETQAGVARKRLKTLMDSPISEIVWFETQYLHGKASQRNPKGRKRYFFLREVALPPRVVMKSLQMDFCRGGRVQLLAAGSWSMRFAKESKPFANGNVTLVNREIDIPAKQGINSIIVECELRETSPQAGFALQGYVIDENRRRQLLCTDRRWIVVEPVKAETVTIAQPGIPPFLGE